MSDIYRCENCRFSLQVEPPPATRKATAEFGNLMCRRYPPERVFDVESDAWRSTLLPVNHNWWCGEWAKR